MRICLSSTRINYYTLGFPISKKTGFTIFFCTLFCITSIAQPAPKNKNVGCGLGYWKNHTELWDETTDALPFCITQSIKMLGQPYSGNALTGSLYNEIFGLTAAEMDNAGLDPLLTLEQVLSLGGGKSINLAKQSISALLNSCAVNYSYSTMQVLSQTHDAIIGENFESLASLFESENDGKCVFAPAPSCSLSGATVACPETASIPYLATIDGTNGAVAYEWSLFNNTAGASFPGSNSGVSSASSLSLNVVPQSSDFTPGGQFNLQLKAARGISTTTCYINATNSPGQTVTIDNLNVTLSATPNLIRVVDANQNPITATSHLTAVVTGGIGPYSYSWTLSPPGDQSVTFINSNSPSITASFSTLSAGNTYTFTVTVTDAAGCVKTAQAIIQVAIGGPKPINPDRLSTHSNPMQEKPGNFEIKVFPNPSRGTFTVRKDITGPIDVRLIDMLGRTIKSWNNLYSESIQLKAFKPGLYSLLIIDRATGKREVKRLVIQP